jgi:multisubunit Na+/H+ antiporter MnhB subunit
MTETVGPAPVSADYLARAAEETGAANSVMAVLLDYRAYDTLGEATVIFVSVLGVFVILRTRGRMRAGHAPLKEAAS